MLRNEGEDAVDHLRFTDPHSSVFGHPEPGGEDGQVYPGKLEGIGDTGQGEVAGYVGYRRHDDGVAAEVTYVRLQFRWLDEGSLTTLQHGAEGGFQFG